MHNIKHLTKTKSPYLFEDRGTDWQNLIQNVLKNLSNDKWHAY